MIARPALDAVTDALRDVVEPREAMEILATRGLLPEGFDVEVIAHVWTDAQRVAFIEAVICGVSVSNRITIAHVGRRAYDLSRGVKGLHAVLLDGKQRLETIRRFMRGELRVFAGVGGRDEGYAFNEMSTAFQRIGRFSVEWRIVVVPTWEDVLRLYLLMNGGGTPHTAEELDRVRAMLRGAL